MRNARFNVLQTLEWSKLELENDLLIFFIVNTSKRDGNEEQTCV